MSTLSVPLSAREEEAIQNLIKWGIVSNKAEAARKGIKKLEEEAAVAMILQAEKEPTLKGDLDELAEKI